MQTFERSVVHRAHSLESIFERARTPAAHAAPRGIIIAMDSSKHGLTRRLGIDIMPEHWG